MSKSRKRSPYDPVGPSLILEAEEILERLAVGNWLPCVDICETADAVSVRVELPGIEPSDMRISFQDQTVRVQGIKRELAAARTRLSYYCLERRYGKFDRQITIERVVDAGRARATLANGVLTIELPRIDNRRGVMFEIPITAQPK